MTRRKHRIWPFLIAVLLFVVAQQAAAQDLSGFAAALLSQWIQLSRQQVLSAGAEPIPPSVIKGLTGYFPPELLRSVRYRSGLDTEWSLPSLAFQYGDVVAVTLVDVVLFRREADAQHDLKLWAHELTHVMQYQRWGIDGFATRYVSDSGAVEGEAYANADRFVIWYQHRTR